jgi:hypothetical protein
MAGERTKSGDPTSEVTAASGALNSPTPREMVQSLAQRLVPHIDRIRAIAGNFGFRPYRCFLVHVAWQGERGLGHARELSRIEITPVPQVRDMDATTLSLMAPGLTEVGGVSVSQISARFTEDDLMGRRMPEMADARFPRTNDEAREFFWEIVENRPSTPLPARRRYRPAGVPMLVRSGMQWRIALTKVDYDADRDGDTERSVSAN